MSKNLFIISARPILSRGESNEHILFGLCCRSPNSDSVYYSTVEDSIHLDVDTGVSDIKVTGNFNLNMLNPQLENSPVSMSAVLFTSDDQGSYSLNRKLFFSN